MLSWTILLFDGLLEFGIWFDHNLDKKLDEVLFFSIGKEAGYGARTADDGHRAYRKPGR
jgi:hypothetical protein